MSRCGKEWLWGRVSQHARPLSGVWSRPDLIHRTKEAQTQLQIPYQLVTIGHLSLVEFQPHGGSWGIGSDSQYSESVAAELRMLECGQRLEHGRQNVLAIPAT